MPTLFEWEDVVRGGKGERSSSLNSELEASPTIAIGANDRRGATALIEIDAGADYLAAGGARGFWNLCSNVSEWTCTPYPGARTQRRKYYQDHPDELTRAWTFPRGARVPVDFWVVGGSFEEEQSTYQAKWDRLYSAGRRDVGFRCAIDANDAIGDEQRFRPK